MRLRVTYGGLLPDMPDLGGQAAEVEGHFARERRREELFASCPFFHLITRRTFLLRGVAEDMLAGVPPNRPEFVDGYTLATDTCWYGVCHRRLEHRTPNPDAVRLLRDTVARMPARRRPAMVQALRRCEDACILGLGTDDEHAAAAEDVAAEDTAEDAAVPVSAPRAPSPRSPAPRRHATRRRARE